MIKQIFKLVWNRKRTNVLIVTEIFFSFLVLFIVVLLGLYYVDNYRHPLGFSWENVWGVTIGNRLAMERDRLSGESAEEFRRIVQAMRDLPEIEAVGGVEMLPFRVGANAGTYDFNGRRAYSYRNRASAGFERALGIEVLQGRWFEPADDALDWEPVVINEGLREALFGNDDPLGRVISKPGAPSEQRVVGVIGDFRQHGQFHGLYNYFFSYKSITKVEGTSPPNLAIRLRPGVPAAFEEKLMRALQAVARDRTFKIEPLSKARASHMRLVLAPVVTAGCIAAFMILMVGLGMVGVVWQSIARRSREIGLRRAVGSTAGGIYAQVLGELVVVTSIGVALGTALVVQVPLLDLIDWFSIPVYLLSVAATIVLMFLLTLACGLYPSWQATKVRPAEVLRYE